MATPDESSPFKCSICFNNKDRRQPRGLSCLHSFCNDCLKQWHEKRHREGHCTRTQVECPTCRTKSALPSGDVSSLPMDFNVQQFADYFNKDSKFILCQLCKSKKGTILCLTCSIVMCEDCSDEHKKSPLFTSHIHTESICERHGAALQCVCTTCLCGVCVHCVKEDLHKGHSLEETSSGINTIKQKIRKCTGELEELVRIGNLKATENRKYIEQFQCIEYMKRKLHIIKKETERLEKEIADHERMCKAKINASFKEYEVHSKRASAAILRGTTLLDEEDNVKILNLLKSAELPNQQMNNQLRAALTSVPELEPIPLSNCRLENVDNATEALAKCKPVCGIPDLTVIPVTPAPPVQVLKIECGYGCDIENPWRLCGTPAGDIIVCGVNGRPVYKVYKDGTKMRLLDDGLAACVHGSDVYIISKDGGTVTQIEQDSSTVKHELKPPISNPKGLFFSDNKVFILSSDTFVKQTLGKNDSRESFVVADSRYLNHILKIIDGGMNKLVFTTYDKHEVIICDEAGSVLTRFGGYGNEDGSLHYPLGISRMSNGHLLVADYNKHRIVEYKMDGTFSRNLFTKRDGLQYPIDVVCNHPYLWVIDHQGLKFFRFSE